MEVPKLVIFDMDGTLIRNTDSVTLLCDMSQADKQVMQSINTEEDEGKISWIDADYKRAKLFKGLEIDTICVEFNNYVSLIQGIDVVIDTLKKRNILTVLITAGPIQVAKIVAEKYNFDYYFGSNYEVINGRFTGEILYHMGSTGKVDCLAKICKEKEISYKDCVAIGDSSSDIDIFKEVGISIAINCSKGLELYATHTICTNDIKEILQYIPL